jgi:hypothetical protein
MDLDIVGSRPEDDTAYSKDSGFIDRVNAQYGRILEQQQLPSELHEKYNLLSKGLGGREAVECSLVNRAAGNYPGLCFGHVITVPNFGRITLGKLTLHHEDFKTGTDIPKKTTLRLTMIDLKFGCAIGGSGGVGPLSTNGSSRP